MSNKTLLVLKHELVQTFRRKSFIIMTLAFPLLALLGLGIYQIVSGNSGPAPMTEPSSVGYVDEVGLFADHTDQPGVKLVPYATDEQAKTAMLDGKVEEYLVIPRDYLTTGIVRRYTLEQELETPGRIVFALKNFLLDNLLEEQSDEVRIRAKAPLSLIGTRLDATGNIATSQGGFGAFILPYLFSILLIMAIFSSSGFLLQGLGEEKQNRVMEILLSSVSARQLLTGKVLGLGAAGLLQMIVWIATIIVVVPLASATIGGLLSTVELPIGMLILGIVYFMLGYFLFAVLMAGLGAISTTPQEGQQLSTLFTLCAFVPLWGSGFIIENPGHAVGVVLSLFPLTSPITVMMRLGLGTIPDWQIIASIAILAVSTVGLLLVAARVFRTFLLMYGKRPALRDIMRAIRQK